MFYAGIVFMVGWIFRAISAYNTHRLDFYIVQTVLVLAGPPIYAASEYNILGRLMHYLPMHSPLNPSRVFFFFFYLGISVETLTGTGAGQLAGSQPGEDSYTVGRVLIAVSLVVQGLVECLFMAFVGLMHYRTARAGMLSPNVRKVCITLYGTSTLVLARCIFRAVENFELFTISDCPPTAIGGCGPIAHHEWFLYVFECAPMVIYTYWLNFMHPGRFLPIEHQRYLDLDGKTERMGPGWIDRRSKWKTFADPFDIKSARHGRPDYARFWERPEEWKPCEDGSFALGTATNRGKSSKLGKMMSEKEQEKQRNRDEEKARAKAAEDSV